MLALQSVHRRQLRLRNHAVEALRAQERVRVLRERGEHRPDERVARARHVHDLLLGDLDRREVLEDDDARARRVARDELARGDVARLEGPRGAPHGVLARDAERGDEPALAALDDEVLEEGEEVDRHLRDAVLDEEGEGAGRGGRGAPVRFGEGAAPREVLEFRAEVAAERHVVHDLPPVPVCRQFERGRACLLIHMCELEDVRCCEGYWSVSNTGRV